MTETTEKDKLIQNTLDDIAYIRRITHQLKNQLKEGKTNEDIARAVVATSVLSDYIKRRWDGDCASLFN